MYDDVISPSANNGDAPEDRDYLDTLPAPGGTEGGKSSSSNVVYTYTGKRIALYIGNLTWVSNGEFCVISRVHTDTLGVGDTEKNPVSLSYIAEWQYSIFLDFLCFGVFVQCWFPQKLG